MLRQGACVVSLIALLVIHPSILRVLPLRALENPQYNELGRLSSECDFQISARTINDVTSLMHHETSGNIDVWTEFYICNMTTVYQPDIKMESESYDWRYLIICSDNGSDFIVILTGLEALVTKSWPAEIIDRAGERLLGHEKLTASENFVLFSRTEYLGSKGGEVIAVGSSWRNAGLEFEIIGGPDLGSMQRCDYELKRRRFNNG